MSVLTSIIVESILHSLVILPACMYIEVHTGTCRYIQVHCRYIRRKSNMDFLCLSLYIKLF